MNNLGVSYDEWERNVPDSPTYNNDPVFAKEWANKLESVVSGYMISPVIKIDDVEYQAKTVSGHSLEAEYVRNYITQFSNGRDVLLYDIISWYESDPLTYLHVTRMKIKFALIPKQGVYYD